MSSCAPSPAAVPSSLMFRSAEAIRAGWGRRAMSDAAPMTEVSEKTVFVVVKIQGKSLKVCEGDSVTIDNLPGRAVGE